MNRIVAAHPQRQIHVILDNLEINSREHFTVYGIERRPFAVPSRWFEGECEIGT